MALTVAELTARLTANVVGFVGPVAAARAEVAALGASAAPAAGEVKKVEGAAASAASQMTKTGTAAAGARRGLGGFTKGASEAETALGKVGVSSRGAFGPIQALTGLSVSAGTAMAAGFGIAGAAAVKMAVQFNTTFVRIKALGGDLGTTIDEAKQKVIDLSDSTGESAQSVAEALYFVSSAGLKANQVMSTLKYSAEAAAAGLGDSQTIAQLLTSTLNAYQGTGLNAAKATDILIAAVRAGKAEPDELAASLGGVIATASQAGVSFDQLAAAVAAATNVGVDARRAVTGLRFLIQNLETPTNKAESALKRYGITSDQLRGMLSGREGLLGTLTFLSRQFDLTSGAGLEAWSDVIGGARGAIVANALVGKNLDSVKKAFDDVHQAGTVAGDDIAGVMRDIREDPGFQFRQAMTQLMNTLLRLGESMVPLFQGAVGALHDAVPVVRVVAEWIGKILQFVQPLLPLIVKLGLAWLAWKGISAVLGSLTGAMGRLTTATEAQAVAAEEGAVAQGSGGKLMGAIKTVGLLAGAWLAVKSNALAASGAAEDNAAKTAAGLAGSAAGGAMAGAAVAGPVGAIVGGGIGLISGGLAAAKGEAQKAGVAIEYVVTRLQKAFDAGRITSDQFANRLMALQPAIDELHPPLTKATADTIAGAKAMRDASADTDGLADKGALLMGVYDRTTAATADLAEHQYMAATAFRKAQQAARDHAAWIENDQGAVEAFAESTGSSFEDFMASATEAAHKGKAEMQKFLSDTRAAYDDWHDEIADNLFSIEGFLGGLSDKQQGSMDKMNKALEGQMRQMDHYGRDWQTVSERAGGKADDLLEAIQAMGLDGATTLHTLATASDTQFRKFVGNVTDAQGKSNSLATIIQDDLVGSINDLIEAIHGIPGFRKTTLDVDVSKAISEIEDFNAKMKDAGIPIHLDIYGAAHGRAEGHAFGGPVGVGYGGGDIVPARLEPGEFVLRKEAVRAMGLQQAMQLNQLGHGKVPGFALGGYVTGMESWQGMTKNLAVSPVEIHVTLPDPSSLVTSGGLTAAAAQYEMAVRTLFPDATMGDKSIRLILGTNTWSQHSYGNAVDTFRDGQTPDPLKQAVADYFSSNASQYNIHYMAYNMRGFTPGSGWNYGNVTSPHYNHVHADFYPQWAGTPGTSAAHPVMGFRAGGILPEDIAGVGASGRRYALHQGEAVTPAGRPTKMSGTFRLARGNGGLTMVLDAEADWIDKSRGW